MHKLCTFWASKNKKKRDFPFSIPVSPKALERAFEKDHHEIYDQIKSFPDYNHHGAYQKEISASISDLQNHNPSG